MGDIEYEIFEDTKRRKLSHVMTEVTHNYGVDKKRIFPYGGNIHGEVGNDNNALENG